MKNVNDYFFKPTERINGMIYIKDGDGNIVTIQGKPKRFKTVTGAAEFIYKLEYARNKLLNKGVK